MLSPVPPDVSPSALERVTTPAFDTEIAAGEDVLYASLLVPIYRLPPCDEKSQCLRFAAAPESERTRFFPVVVAIWRVANGVVVPKPRFPIDESKRNGDLPAVPKTMVDDA